MPTISQLIIIVLDQNGGEVHGIENLAALTNTLNEKSWLRQCLEEMEHNGHIHIERRNGGRGNKNIVIRKRNPNSAGMPRRVRRLS